MVIPGVTSWSPPTKAAAAAADDSQTCTIHHYALDSGKESPLAFGPPVEVSSPVTTADEPAIMAQLHATRACDVAAGHLTGDPSILAAHYASWSEAGQAAHLKLTTYTVNYSDIDAFAASLAADYPKWQAAEKELEKLENGSSFSLAPVPAGTWTLYMVPDGHGGVTTHQGYTIGNGTNVVFTHGTVTVRYRLDCRFQPNVPGTSGFGVPNVPPGTPEFPTCAAHNLSGTWPNCYTPCEWNASIPSNSLSCQPPTCAMEHKAGTWPNCYVPTCTTCLTGKGPYHPNPGWVPRPIGGDDTLTDGQASARQKAAGQTSGNVTDKKVASGTTSGSTTSDLGGGTTTATSGTTATSPGAKSGGDDRSNDVTDTTTTKQDDGGTSGATCVTNPFTGVNSCK